MKNRKMTRRAVCGGLAAFAFVRPVMAAQPQSVTVYRDPNCGCCLGWVRHLRNNGFTVAIEDTSDLETVRSRHRVPADLAGCHTALIDGYVIEGHVPAAAIRRLLAERPKALGLAVPGMPMGSPGMEGGTPERYAAVLFAPDRRLVFMQFIGADPVG